MPIIHGAHLLNNEIELLEKKAMKHSITTKFNERFEPNITFEKRLQSIFITDQSLKQFLDNFIKMKKCFDKFKKEIINREVDYQNMHNDLFIGDIIFGIFLLEPRYLDNSTSQMNWYNQMLQPFMNQTNISADLRLQYKLVKIFELPLHEIVLIPTKNLMRNWPSVNIKDELNKIMRK
ncbi:hypothetical protein TRFO_18944 [Tritrichomonas foetus]|uniref:Uncharacterized protein n=1 Tax=Tritrichomonas foetus TaxID=1144522 RepID=A0A1J4KKC3_9EUKA|nr:hypothetical protein TRFO_18944 [Tritrichomonas foetus]|eukprot:OHT11578.1 hypothetical protein TRFO_18944 [Tritrichomonas foetus]